MCWNLRNKEYHIKNHPYSKEEYFKKIQSYNLNSRKSLQNLRTQFDEHIKNDAINKADFNINVENCMGNFLTNCKNCFNSYLWF